MLAFLLPLIAAPALAASTNSSLDDTLAFVQVAQLRQVPVLDTTLKGACQAIIFDAHDFQRPDDGSFRPRYSVSLSWTRSRCHQLGSGWRETYPMRSGVFWAHFGCSLRVYESTGCSGQQRNVAYGGRTFNQYTGIEKLHPAGDETRFFKSARCFCREETFNMLEVVNGTAGEAPEMEADDRVHPGDGQGLEDLVQGDGKLFDGNATEEEAAQEEGEASTQEGSTDEEADEAEEDRAAEEEGEEASMREDDSTDGEQGEEEDQAEEVLENATASLQGRFFRTSRPCLIHFYAGRLFFGQNYRFAFDIRWPPYPLGSRRRNSRCLRAFPEQAAQRPSFYAMSDAGCDIYLHTQKGCRGQRATVIDGSGRADKEAGTSRIVIQEDWRLAQSASCVCRDNALGRRRRGIRR